MQSFDIANAEVAADELRLALLHEARARSLPAQVRRSRRFDGTYIVDATLSAALGPNVLRRTRALFYLRDIEFNSDRCVMSLHLSVEQWSRHFGSIRWFELEDLRVLFQIAEGFIPPWSLEPHLRSRHEEMTLLHGQRLSEIVSAPSYLRWLIWPLLTHPVTVMFMVVFGFFLPLLVLPLACAAIAQSLSWLLLRLQRTSWSLVAIKIGRPRRLRFRSSWTTIVPDTARLHEQLAEEIASTMGHATAGQHSENQQTLGNSGSRISIEQVDASAPASSSCRRMVVQFRRAVVEVYLDQYGNDLLIHWLSAINVGGWRSQPKTQGFHQLTNHRVVGVGSVPTETDVTEYDLVDLHFIQQYTHETIRKVLVVSIKDRQVLEQVNHAFAQRATREQRSDSNFNRGRGN